MTTGYTYDLASNRLSMTDPAQGVTNYVYDTLNRLTSLAPPSAISGAFGFGYDMLSRRTQLSRPNGVNTSYSYDELSRLLSVAHQKNSSTLDGATYTYDAAGNRTSKYNSMLAFTTSFSYDPTYELTTALPSGPGGESESYGYDEVGNRLSSESGNYTYNSSNEMLTSPGNLSYAYDANGNVTSKTPGTGPATSYTWDFENRLATATVPSVPNAITVTFKYDPFGRRIEKVSSTGTTTIYAYDGDSVVQEMDQNGNPTARYAQGRVLTSRWPSYVRERRATTRPTAWAPSLRSPAARVRSPRPTFTIPSETITAPRAP